MQISTRSSSKTPINIAILALDGAIYSSIIGPLDVFSVANGLRAASGQPDFAQVRILKAGDRAPLSFNQLKIHIQGHIQDADRFDLALYLVRKFGSAELAAGCSKFLLIDSRRRSQSPYQPGQFQKSHADGQILSLQEYLEHHYAEPLTLAQLAENIGLGQRTLLRRFRTATGDSPIMYLQRMRIEAARRKLELTDSRIDQIAWQVGYENTSVPSAACSKD